MERNWAAIKRVCAKQWKVPEDRIIAPPDLPMNSDGDTYWLCADWPSPRQLPPAIAPTAGSTLTHMVGLD